MKFQNGPKPWGNHICIWSTDSIFHKIFPIKTVQISKHIEACNASSCTLSQSTKKLHSILIHSTNLPSKS